MSLGPVLQILIVYVVVGRITSGSTRILLEDGIYNFIFPIRFSINIYTKYQPILLAFPFSTGPSYQTTTESTELDTIITSQDDSSIAIETFPSNSSIDANLEVTSSDLGLIYQSTPHLSHTVRY